MDSKRKILVAGLGGGLDIVNASILYYTIKNDGSHQTMLGSTRPVSGNLITNSKQFADSGVIINAKSKINMKGRYAEPRVSEVIKEEVILYCREYRSRFDMAKLGDAIKDSVSTFSLTDIIFVDGGGDSLILTSKDAIKHSQDTDPFKGGDAQLLEALYETDIPANVYQGIIAVGLDVDEEAFAKNIQLLKDRNAYFGRVNIATGQKEDFKLDHLLEFKPGYLNGYYSLTNQVLAVTKEDTANRSKLLSHTGTVTFHALKGSFGLQRTWVPWEPVHQDGSKGVFVKQEHQWMYFVDAKAVHRLKLDLNR